MKKIISLVLMLTLSALLFCSCGKESYGKSFEAKTGIDTTDHVIHNAEITVKGYGIITVALDETVAPITVKNFVKLASEGFYDGLTFHRIMSGFMIQGGDPNGNGTGGSPDEIIGEFSSNGIENNLRHVRGVLSMARRGANPWASEEEKEAARNSASSQFFIMHQDYPSLNGDYAAFGWVTSGMEFVDAICADAKPTDKNGTIPKSKQPIITSIRIIEK